MPKDTTLAPLLDFLILEGYEIKNLTQVTESFEAALDTLQCSSFRGEQYDVYLNAVHEKFIELKRNLDYREGMRHWEELHHGKKGGENA